MSDKKRRIYLGQITCPSRMDIPLMVVMWSVWLIVIVGLVFTFSPWFALLLLLTPSFKRVK